MTWNLIRLRNQHRLTYYSTAASLWPRIGLLPIRALGLGWVVVFVSSGLAYELKLVWFGAMSHSSKHLFSQFRTEEAFTGVRHCDTFKEPIRGEGRGRRHVTHCYTHSRGSACRAARIEMGGSLV